MRPQRAETHTICRLIAPLCWLLACDPASPGGGGGSTTGTTVDVATADTGTTTEETSDEAAFAEACDQGAGWLANDDLRRACSDWLVAYCGAREISSCEVSFSTSDGYQLGCFTSTIASFVDGACDAGAPACTAGLESELYLCNSCDGDANVQTKALDNGDSELVILSADHCGISVFVDGYGSCQGEEGAACACACGP